MSLNSTPSSERIHIGIFGRRNAGKSSLINALTGQNLAIVSDVRGTTTDPVFKSMELLPLGPIVMIDTPGLDDEGELGKLRIQKAYQVLNKTDIAVLVIDGTSGITPQDNAILTRIQDKNIPLLLVLNKADLVSEHTHQEMIVSTHLKYKIPLEHILWTNTTENLHIHELKERLGTLVPAEESSRFIVRDLVTPGDFIVRAKGKADSPTAADDPRSSGCRNYCNRCKGNRTQKYVGFTREKTCTGDYRQSGI